MRLFNFLFFSFLFALQTNAQGIEFFHGTFEEALAAAKAEDKLIFVDAYTTWCGPCKKMSKLVFTQPEVGEFYNENFINLKLDMEKPEGRQFQVKYPVQAYPTLYYINYDGKVAMKVKGARKVEDFIAVGRSALGKVDNSGEYAEKYEAGDRDPELVFNYVKALNKAGKPSMKIANDYLNSQEDLTTPQNLKFILEAVTEADSRIFDLLIQHRGKIESITSAQSVEKKIHTACKATAQKAVEFEMEDLLTEASDKMKKHCPAQAEMFSTNESLRFYSKMGDSKKYLKACMQHVKKNVKEDAKQLNALARDIDTTFPNDSKCMAYAEKIAGKSAQNGGLFNYYLTYASILHKNGKKSEALENANKAKELAKGDRRAEMTIEKMIQRFES